VRRLAVVLLTTWGLAGLTSTKSMAQEATTIGPRVVFDQVLHDFGELRQGRSLEHDYVFSNVGDAPLHIQRVNPSCGCTVAEQPSEPVPPGGKGRIRVAFDSRLRKGMQDFRILVYTNELSSKPALLLFRGEVLTDFLMTPPVLHFGQVVRGGEGATRRARLQRGKAKSFKILGVGRTPDYFKVECVPRPEGGYDIVAEIDGSAPFGQLEQLVELTTDNPLQPRLSFKLFAAVQPLFVTPPSFHMDRVERGVVRSFSVARIDEGRGLDLIDVRADSSRFVVSAHEAEPGRRLQVSLRVRPDAPPGPFSCEVVIRVASARCPRLVMPLTGSILAPVRAQPPGLFVGGAVSVGTVLGELDLQGSGATREGLVSVSVVGAPAEAELRFMNGRCVLRVVATASAPAEAFRGARVVLGTRHAGQPSLEVPFVARP
jgi:hypothetical protein